MELSELDLKTADDRLAALKAESCLGQLQASGVAGNDVAGSVYVRSSVYLMRLICHRFYAFPLVAATCSIYSPLALLISCAALFLFRPIMRELASAYPQSGGAYSYLQNTTTSKSISIFAAAIMLLDFASTAVVSAASAATYIRGEFGTFPFQEHWLAVMIIVFFAVVSLLGIKESTGVASGIFSMHLIVMTMLIIAGLWTVWPCCAH